MTITAACNDDDYHDQDEQYDAEYDEGWKDNIENKNIFF